MTHWKEYGSKWLRPDLFITLEFVCTDWERHRTPQSDKPASLSKIGLDISQILLQHYYKQVACDNNYN
jgi:hypothetical protein